MLVRWTSALFLLTALISGAGAPGHPYLHAPSVETYAVQDPAGRTILSNGRYLTPVGRHTPVGRMPYGLAMSRDGNMLFVASAGVGQIITGWRDAKPTVVAVKPPGRKKAPIRKAGRTPAARISHRTGGRSIGAAAIRGRFMSSTRRAPDKSAEISLNVAVGGRTFEDSYAVDVKVSADGKYLYCADVTNFRARRHRHGSRRLVGSVPVGRYPYALAVAGNRVYVANIGLFEYSAIPPPKVGGIDPRGLTFPPFGYPSQEARDGVEVEGRKMPGLGEPNVPESFSVWGVDVSESGDAEGDQPDQDRPARRRTVGQRQDRRRQRAQFPGRSWRIAVRLQRQQRHDRTDRSDARRHRRPSSESSRRRWWSGCAASARPAWSSPRTAPASTSPRLGINAIAVLDARTLRILGHIPTAWYPYRVAAFARRPIAGLHLLPRVRQRPERRQGDPQERVSRHAGRAQRARRADRRRPRRP